MRRSLRWGVVIALLCVALSGAYAAYWVIAAGRIEAGLTAWAAGLKAQHADLSWQRMRVGGFPLAFRVALHEARLRAAGDHAVALSVPVLSGWARPWNLPVWRLTAPQGLAAGVGAGARLTAKSAEGVAIVGAAGTKIQLRLAMPVARVGERVAAQRADLRLTLPAHKPRSHTDPQFGFAADLHQVTLPAVPPPFTNPLDELAFRMTALGPIPDAPPRQAAAAWRDAGGTLELDHFRLRWGPLAITGSGTLALDSGLQPIGGFSGSIEGYDQLIQALVAARVLPSGDARLARLALAMLATAGPDGRQRIRTAFTIQNGEMYLGPAKLGPAPRLRWP